MSFSEALRLIKNGDRVCRDGWNGKGLWLMMQRPDSKMNRPYIYIRAANGEIEPWMPSQSDLLADDWVEL